MSELTDGRDPFEVVAESFLARLRAGERPSISEYAARHPDLADRIRKLLPALVMVEQDVMLDLDPGLKATQPRPAAAPGKERRLGDYRILREIGRGGMGVVYEAEQVSLNRRVALKVLPGHIARDKMALERFRREAKAAARLHHTNIVPVFEVGSDGEVAYYAMQFIQGQGLDQVIDELARLRDPTRKPGGTEGPGPTAAVAATPVRKPALSRVAESLLIGRFGTEGAMPSSHVPLEAATGPAATERLARDVTHSSDFVISDPEQAGSGPTMAPQSSAAVLPGGSQVSTAQLSGRRAPFFQSVAQIGRQTAQGLAYAHASGIVHRDIKPSNLLLDHAGVVWIADFGLAKGEDEGLTQSGDVLGTLRYMAPERFRGEGDARADIYALGLSLYELLTLRPGFDSSDRLRLIEQIKTQEPSKPRSIDARIPRDLETIVLKAIEKDPKARYQSAEVMAEDLRRFLADEPIKARQVSASERYWRWARRNPVIAVLGGVLTAVLTVGFVVMAVLWSRAEQSADNARSKEQIAQTLATNEAKARGKAAAQEQIALEKAEQLAREDYVNRVNRAYREVQDDNIRLAQDLLHGCPPERRGWEWHYVKRLAHLDLMTLEGGSGSVETLAFSPVGQWVVTGTGKPLYDDSPGGPSPSIHVWDVAAGTRRRTLQGMTSAMVAGLAVSPDGTKIAACGGSQVIVWNASNGEVLWTRSEAAGQDSQSAMSITFTPNGRSLVVGYGAYAGQDRGYVKVCDSATGRESLRLPGPVGGVNKLAIHPDGKQLALAGSEVIELWDIAARTKQGELRGHERWVFCLAFSPDGKRLATGGWDRTIRLWDVKRADLERVLYGHEGFVTGLAFSSEGTRLASTSEDRSVRLWDSSTGRLTATVHGHESFVQTVAFQPNGREFATGGDDGRFKIWDVRTCTPIVFEGHRAWVVNLAIRRDGRRVFSEAGQFRTPDDTTQVWDPTTGEADPKLAGVKRAALSADFVSGAIRNNLIVTSTDGQLEAEAAGHKDRVDYGGDTIVVRERGSGRMRFTLAGHSSNVVCLLFSPDGRRLATASDDRTIKLWDTTTGREVFTLLGHTGGLRCLAFSPDGNRIVSGGVDATARVWDATPLPSNVIAEHDVLYRKKHERKVESNSPNDRYSRAMSLATSDQLDLVAEAMADLDDLTKLSDWTSVQWYNFACIYCIASVKIADKKQECSDRAMEMLQKAVKGGFNKAAHMKQDTDLDPLRDREDFKKLIAGMEQPLSPSQQGR